MSGVIPVRLTWRGRLRSRVMVLRWRWESLGWRHRWARPLGWLARTWYRAERWFRGARRLPTATMDEVFTGGGKGGTDAVV